MEGTISPLEYREDCSGRSMATLLVAWVSAAMVASILLRWKYMWIALAILTILFLIACALAAYSSRRSADDEDEEAAAREESRFNHPRMDIQSISADISQTYPYRVEPPAYTNYWITELPPPYTVVIGSDPPPLLAQLQNSSTTDEGTQPSNNVESQLSSPPPYSVAIQPNHTSIQIGTLNDHHYQTDHTNNTVVPITTSQSVSINRNDNNNNNNNNNKDETDDGSKTPPPNVLSTGTQYLSNFISNTFGRGQQRLRNFERRTSAGIVSISANQESTSSCSRTGQTTS